MKAFKISLLLVVIVVLTVSVVSRDTVDQGDVNTYKKSKTTYNPIAHNKKKRVLVSNG